MARQRRSLSRAMQAHMNDMRLRWGLPVPPGTLQQQVRSEMTNQLEAQLKASVNYRVGLEKAYAAGQQTAK